jgi:hypothetical protein
LPVRADTSDTSLNAPNGAAVICALRRPQA